MMLVRKRGGEEVYAMKVLKKEALVRRNQVYTISYVYCMHGMHVLSAQEGGAPTRCVVLTDVVPLWRDQMVTV